MSIIDGIYLKSSRALGLYQNDKIGPFETTDFTEEERNQSDLHRLFYGNDGPLVHKWKHYLAIYDRYLSRFRNTPARLLEIGVSKGGSMRLWRKYFGAQAIIFGIDIDPKCASLDGQHASVRIGSQADEAFLARVLDEMGGVDVVIDDGSHICSHQVKSFNFLFPKLSRGGVYLCEDLHSNYWPGEFEGGYRRSSTFIELCKRFVDGMHSDFHSKASDDVCSEISGVHFFNSMIVMEKDKQERPSHIKIGR